MTLEQLKLEDKAQCERWDAFVDAHPLGWWWHRTEWLKYCIAYKGGLNRSFFQLAPGGRWMAVAPLLQEGTQFSAGHDPLASGICIGDDFERAQVINHIDWLAGLYGVTEGRWRSCPLLQPIPEHWTEGCGWKSRVLDLTTCHATLHAGLRKSYTSIINKGQERLSIMTSDTLAAFYEYRDLHRQVAHSRNDKTYDCQASWLLDRRAVVTLAWDACTLVGAAYFNCYKGKAYYASAAYLRPDVAHPLLWSSILDLKAAGITALELGWQGYAKDEKGKNVEFFKAGFGGQDVPVGVMTRRWAHEAA